MFIVIDGIDGSGKTTQVKLLSQALKRKGKTVKIIDFPRYEKESSFFAKKYLNGEYGKKLSPKLSSLFYALDRYDAKQDIEKYLKKYDYVLSNRYTTSSMIHQSGKIQNTQEREDFIKWLEEMEYSICDIPKPEIIFFLDVSPEITEKLLLKKNQRGYIKRGNKDLHEKDRSHQREAYKQAIYLAQKKGWNIISCTEKKSILSKEYITNNLLQTINGFEQKNRR